MEHVLRELYFMSIYVIFEYHMVCHSENIIENTHLISLKTNTVFVRAGYAHTGKVTEEYYELFNRMFYCVSME